jgi:signal transduction histidine kinase
MTFFSISSLFIFISSFILGIVVLIKAKKRIQYIWGFFCVAVSIWGLGGFFIGISNSAESSLFWWRMSYIGVICIPALFTLFTLEFIGKINKINIFLIVTTTLFFLYFNLFTNSFIANVGAVFENFYYIINPTLLYNFFVIYFTGIIYFDFVFIWKLSTEDRHKKHQARYVLLGCTIGFFGGLFAFLPVYGVQIYPVMNSLIIIYPFTVAYAIFKHNLMDLRIVVQRGLIYSIVLTFIIILYLGFLSVIQSHLKLSTQSNFIVASLLTTVIGIYTVPKLEKFFQSKTDKIFFKDKYDYKEAIYIISEVVNKNLELEELLKKLIVNLKKILKVESIKILIRDKNLVFDEEFKFRKPKVNISSEYYNSFRLSGHKVLQVKDVDYLKKEITDKKILQAIDLAKRSAQIFKVDTFVSVEQAKSVIGLIILGSKKSGDNFSSDDVNLLKTVSYQAALAIEKARLYEKVKDYSKTLEQKVVDRTEKIKNMQEEQKQMMLEIAHGLQTPLTIIKGEISSLTKNKERQKELFGIEKSINRISKFIYDMLRLANLEFSKSNQSFNKFSLSDLFLEMVESFEIITEEKNIRIKSEIEKDIMFYGSQEDIEELITNLVSNSVKYMMDKLKREISIQLKKSNKHIIISVKDTGVGIKKEYLDKLFSRFYRVKEEEGSTRRGTGLGLAICKEIVEKHQGEIKIFSEYGQGTEIIIKFPINSEK